jgi:hypothetical protein
VRSVLAGLLLCSLPAALWGQAPKPVDFTLAGLSTALIVADWSQTLRLIREPLTRHEGNPLLGRYPSEGRVNTMLSLAVLTNAAALWLPRRPRRIWHAALMLLEGVAVTHNLTHGLSVGF